MQHALARLDRELDRVARTSVLAAVDVDGVFIKNIYMYGNGMLRRRPPTARETRPERRRDVPVTHDTEHAATRDARRPGPGPTPACGTVYGGTAEGHGTAHGPEEGHRALLLTYDEASGPRSNHRAWPAPV